MNGDYSAYDAALQGIKYAEEKTGDPDISRRIAWFDNLLNSIEVDDRNEIQRSEEDLE